MKIFKTTFLLIFILFTVITANAQWINKNIKGDGNLTTITRAISDYDSIKLNGWMNFVLVQGEEGTITLEGESNLLDYIITKSEDNCLVVKIKNNYNLKPSGSKSIKIIIPFKMFNKISLLGSGDVISKSVIVADNFETNLSGSGDISIELNSKLAACKVTGSGEINLTGSTKHLEAIVTGSGDFNAKNFSADYTEAKVIGSGDMSVTGYKELKAKVIGSGDIKYLGTPDKLNTKVIGSGDISN